MLGRQLLGAQGASSCSEMPGASGEGPSLPHSLPSPPHPHPWPGRMWEQGVVSVEVEAGSCDCLLNEWLQRGLGLGTGMRAVSRVFPYLAAAHKVCKAQVPSAGTLPPGAAPSGGTAGDEAPPVVRASVPSQGLSGADPAAQPLPCRVLVQPEPSQASVQRRQVPDLVVMGGCARGFPVDWGQLGFLGRDLYLNSDVG